MKIEKVNDHQIRCTLTKADLADRHMKLSELAYGTDKAKNLFRDMMQQAAYEFGFEADDIPLMIEAIPLSGDCIVLIITKVEDPEELDTRFSRFAPALEEGEDSDAGDSTNSSSVHVTADDVIDLFKKLHNELAETANKISAATDSKEPAKIEISVADDICRLYKFNDLDDAIRLSKVLNGFYHGENTMYKSVNPFGYYLLVHKSDHTPEDFNKICNIMSEYSQALRHSEGTISFLKEHSKVLIGEDAVQKLSTIS